MRPLRTATAGAVAAVLLVLPACSWRGDDGTHEVTVALGGVPDRPAQDVQVQLDGPVQRELTVETGELKLALTRRLSRPPPARAAPRASAR